MLDQARLERETLKKIRLRLKTTRKSLGVSTIATAEAAGISRITLHRVKNGEPTVNVSAYVRVATVLDLDIAIQAKDQFCRETSKSLDLPVRILLREYPGLRQLAWHLPDAQSLSLLEAYRLFERNQRHLDHAYLTDAERDLRHALQSAFQEELWVSLVLITRKLQRFWRLWMRLCSCGPVVVLLRSLDKIHFEMYSFLYFKNISATGGSCDGSPDLFRCSCSV